MSYKFSPGDRVAIRDKPHNPYSGIINDGEPGTVTEIRILSAPGGKTYTLYTVEFDHSDVHSPISFPPSCLQKL